MAVIQIKYKLGYNGNESSKMNIKTRRERFKLSGVRMGWEQFTFTQS